MTRARAAKSSPATGTAVILCGCYIFCEQCDKYVPVELRYIKSKDEIRNQPRCGRHRNIKKVVTTGPNPPDSVAPILGTRETSL